MKNRTMKIAMIVLALVLATSCFVGSTFAKYITSNSVRDNAVVAYWGFSEPATVEFNLFDMRADTGVAADGKIAPGTTNSKTIAFFNAKQADKAPEVAYRVTVDTTGSTEVLNTALDAQLTWTLKVGDGAVQPFDTWAELITAIKTLSGEADGSKDYAPNAELPAFLENATNTTIGWTWAFEPVAPDADAFEDDVAAYEAALAEYEAALAAWNAADTAIGNLGTLPTIDLVITITVEQIDTYVAP